MHNKYILIKIDVSTIILLIGIAVLTVSVTSPEKSWAIGPFNDNRLILTTASGAEFLTYDDIISGFSIKYPSNWQSEEHIDKSVTFIAPKQSNSDPFPAGLGIMSKNVPANISIAAITQKQINTLKSLYPDIRISESLDTTFLGHPAHKITFTATDNTKTLRKAMQIWFKSDTKTYLITYKASETKFTSFLPVVEQMLNSFYTYEPSRSQ